MIEKLITFKEKMIDLFVANIPLDSLSETDHDFMTDLAENGEGLARYQAQELLCFFYNECAEYPVITSTTTSMAPLFQDMDTERLVLSAVEVSRSDRSFKIYPNPAQSWVAIELPAVDSPLIITVVDLSGRVIYQKQLNGVANTDRLGTVEIWDTQLIGNGVYLITITDVLSAESYGTQKVVIQN